MNNTFELKRFGWVFKKLIFERSLHLVGSFTLVALFTWFLYSVTGRVYDGEAVTPAQESFGIGLTFGGIYWVFTSFSYFSNNTEGYSYLMLPASYLEKWLSSVLLLGVFILLFCLYFRILDTIYLDKFLEKMVSYKDYSKILATAYPLSFWGETRVSLEFHYFAFFNATSAMAVGTLYFNKNAFIKTAFISLVFSIGLSFLNMKVGGMLLNEGVNVIPQELWRSAFVSKAESYVRLPEPINTAYMIGFDYLLPVALWLIALIRLREKEL
jgi:hypothetical protein